MENELHLTDLIDVEMLQRIQDAFSDMTGIASVTTDADGVAVTKGSHFSDFCMKYTRSSPLGCQRCELCDKNGAELALKKGASSTYFCHAGLVDFAAPIIADGRMVGCFIGGQVLTEPPDISKIMQVADELGVDPASYIQAVMKVNIVEKSQIDKAASFLYTIANGLSNIAYHKYQLFQANIEIEKANRMKSDFLANMSHEIRTPMNAVIGMAEMALREDLPPAARDYITQIKASGKTLLTIINDILDFSKIESGKMNIIPVEYEPMSTIHDVANIITTRIGSKNVELILDIAPDIPYKLFGDSIRFKQILLNLANNAVKFTKHGRVLLKIYAGPVENGETVLHASIEDTGIGIKKEQIGRLFRSFEQLDSKRNRNIEGTGLGLAISKLLLTLMHGTISVESEYGIGSTFSFTLPQKVLDDRPSGVFNNDPPVHAALFIKNSLVQEQLQKDLDRLHIAYDNCTVTGTEPDNTPDYLFIDYAVFSSAMQDYIQSHPELTAVLITDFYTSVSCNLKNLHIVKKPLYSLNLISILKNEDLHFDEEDDADHFEFTAPDAQILIVDDNAINLTVTEGLLKPLGMQIDTCLSGKEAIEKISSQMYDIIFMDHMMPELDGVETTHIIRRFHPEYDDVPIIALTANAIDGTKEMFLKEGMNDFVPKPIELQFLTAKIKHWLPAEKIDRQHGMSASRNTTGTDNTVTATNAAADNTQALPAIEGLDTKAAIQLLGSPQLYMTVLKDYYRVIKQKAELIKKYEQQEDWHAYTIETHALKSASRQIGATDLAESAARLELAGSRQDAALIHEQTAFILHDYLQYQSILQPYFQKEEKISAQETITAPVLEKLFYAMYDAIDNLDSDTMESTLEEMTHFIYPDNQLEFLNQLKTAVSDIDVEQCTKILDAWKSVV